MTITGRSVTALILGLLLFGGCGEADRDASNPPVPTAGTDGREQDETAPDEYRVKFDTSKGDFVVAVHRDWAPRGADRFYTLVKNGYYDGCRFFRVVEGFVVQFGINGDPEVSAKWVDNTIPDDPVKQSNVRGTITFATGGPDSRTTQVFINLDDTPRLDEDGFSPFGEVVEGMNVVDSLYSGYGEQLTQLQEQIHRQGNAFLDENFPRLDYIEKATLIER